ncbi:MAG TPA: helix-turn-helix domain-containing protein [Candidatus Paceibacterota bacterium]|nr:helix-turn-helix domain-containing protein [Candidatus Paceibacterota bacterium]
MANIENKKNIFQFGDFLRQKREEKGITLEKLETLTKIKKTILDDLENERFEKLPPKIYIRGIISKYCQYVELNPVEVINTFDKYFYENRSDKFNIGKVVNINDAFKKVKAKHFDFAKILIFVLGILILSFVIRQASLMILPPSVEMINPKEETSYTNTAINIQGRVLRTKFLTVNNQPVLFDKYGYFEYMMILDPGVNEIRIIAKNQLNKSMTIIRNVVYQEEIERVNGN